MPDQMYDKVEFFRSYFARATEKPTLIKEFEKRFSNSSNQKLSFLDLGCHDGALISKIFDTLGNKLTQGATLVGVDPSQGSIDEFSKRSFSIDPVHLTLHPLTAEAYFEKEAPQEHFDWVIASHCLYWTKNLERTVENIIKSAKNGVLVLRGTHGIYEIQSKFKKLLGNSDEQLYTANEIEAVFQTSGQNFER